MRAERLSQEERGQDVKTGDPCSAGGLGADDKKGIAGLTEKVVFLQKKVQIVGSGGSSLYGRSSRGYDHHRELWSGDRGYGSGLPCPPDPSAWTAGICRPRDVFPA